MSRRQRPANAVTHFSLALEKAMLDAGLKSQRLAEESGVHPSIISKLLTSKILTISADHLERLCLAISKSPSVHVDLIIAHLEDHRFGPHCNQVEIRSTIQPTTPRPKSVSELELALSILAQVSAGSSAVAASLIEQAKAFRPLPFKRGRERQFALGKAAGKKVSARK